MSFIPESIPESVGAVRVFMEAHDIAKRACQPMSSVHVLFALFTFPNKAKLLLTEHAVDEDRLLATLTVVEEESPKVVVSLRKRAADVARMVQAKQVDCLHVLIALMRLQEAFGYRLLDRSGVAVGSLRNVAMSYVTGNMPRRYRELKRELPEGEPLVQSRRRPSSTNASGRGAAAFTAASTAASPRRLDPPKSIARPQQTASSGQSGAAGASRQAAGASETPAAKAVPAPVTLPQPRAAPLQQPPASTTAATSSSRAGTSTATPSLESLAPTLAAFGIDLTERGRRGEIDRVLGREQELAALIDILCKRRANNPVLVGPPGVGKTAVVEGLAVKMARGDEDVAHLGDRFLVSLDTGTLVAGTSLRGSFSERLGAIKAEVAAADRRIIVFIDEVHTLIGAGTSGDGPQDAASELKTALARGEFPCIGATTIDEYKKYIEKDPALERRFSPVAINEPSPDEAVLILEGALGAYAAHHQVVYSIEAIEAAVRLSHRFINERKLPDKAFAVLDLAGSRARRLGKAHVDRMEVAQIVHEWTAVPLERLADTDADRMRRAEEWIGQKLIGHEEVVHAVCGAIRRGLAGFNGKRPIGSFLFLGPTGVGKTELVKIVAEFLFGRRDAVVSLDMSELAEKHSVARLLGAQPGYVGYEEGGQLTEALRKRPFQVVLFDEIEKAHPDVLNLLLQILDEGHLTDAQGRRVSFANTLVILTSNLGIETSRGAGGGRAMGFTSGFTSESAEVTSVSVPRCNEAAVRQAAQAALAPELWGRLGERLVFQPLAREQVRRIAALQLEESSKALFSERDIQVRWSEGLVDFLLRHGGFSPSTGARGMRQAIQRWVEGPIAERILARDYKAGDIFYADVDAQQDCVTIDLRTPDGKRRPRRPRRPRASAS